jgi:hypothetical protein
LREAASWRADRNESHAPRADLQLLRQEPDSPAAARLPTLPAVESARQAWAAAQRTRRRWGFVGAGVAVVVLLAVAAPRGGPEVTVEAQPPPTATPGTMPDWIDVLPTADQQATLPTVDTPLPPELDVSAIGAGAPGISRALLLLLPVDGPPLVLGADRVLRPISGLTFPARQPGRLGSTPVTAASLTRDGTRAAFITGDGIAVVELRTGNTRQFTVTGRITDLAWLDTQTIVVGGPRVMRQIDLRTGNVSSATVDARHALTRQDLAVAPSAPVPSPATSALGLPPGAAEQVVELLPLGEPATAPARVRRYARSGPDSVTPVVTPIGGDRTGWVGQWIGPGFVHGDLAVRDCDAREMMIPLPSGRPAAVNATVVVDTRTGTVRRALVASLDATRTPEPKLLGWLDQDTVLVVTSSGVAQRLLAWRITDGQLRRVAEIEGPALLSVADLAVAT